MRADRPKSTGSGSSGHESKGSKGSKGSTGKTHSTTGADICAFWLDQKCFGLDVSLVGEVVRIERVTEVPLAPVEVLGLFNLRGIPVPILDLSRVLGIAGKSAVVDASRGITALVLRHESLTAAVMIDRMELVLSANRGKFTPADSGAENPVIAGFLQAAERDGLILTVLNPEMVTERLYAIRMAEQDSR